MGGFFSREKHYRNKVGSEYISNYSDLSKLFKNLEQKDQNDKNFYTTITESSISLKLVENVKTLICSLDGNSILNDYDEILTNLRDVYKIFERNIYTSSKGNITSVQDFDRLFNLLSSCELLEDNSTGSFKELLKFILEQVGKLIKDVEKAIKYYEGKNETKLESAYYWTVGWFSYLSDFSTFKKMASYYSEYKRDLVTFKADINNFIKDINFVDGMFEKLKVKLTEIKTDLTQLNQTLANSSSNNQQHQRTKFDNDFGKKKKLALGFIGSIIGKLNLRRIE